MPTSTDLVDLACIGYVRPRSEAELAADDGRERRDDDVMPVLIRT